MRSRHPTACPAADAASFPTCPHGSASIPNGGSFQIAGILRQLRFVSDGGAIDETTTGYGFDISGKAHLRKRDAIMGHVTWGSGHGRYIEAFSGNDTDAALTPDGDLEALDAFAAVLGYELQWNERFRSTLAGSMAEVDNDQPSQPDDAIEAVRSVHANLVYSPNKLFNVGGELMWGERENNDGADGDALRLQVSLQYKFR